MYYNKEQIERARNDLRVFLFIVWKEIGLPDPTKVQYDMANFLQHPPHDRVILEAFRGVGKSFVTCAFVVWRLWNNPQLKVMVVSASKDRADANAIFIKRIINLLPFLAHLKPAVDKGQRDTQNLFDVGPAVPDISPSVKSVGITGQMTGSRADILISDDCESANNSCTQIQRDKLSEAVKEFDAILKPGGRVIYLGTPQNEMSLYNELQNRGYVCRIWPVQYPTVKEREAYGDRLAPSIAEAGDKDPMLEGHPTDPERFDEEEIEKRKLSYGRAGFQLQFMLNTSLSDAERYPLKLQDFIVAEIGPEESSMDWHWSTSNKLTEVPSVGLKGDYFYGPLSRSEQCSKYTGTVMALDISGRGSDETAYVILKFLNGFLFLMEVGGFRDGYGESTLESLAQKAKFWGVNEVVCEANFGDGMFGQLFKPVLNKIYPCAYSEVKNMKQKEARIIDTLEPVLSRHKIILNPAVIQADYRVYEKDQKYSLFYQMTRLTRDKGALAHDDRLDALAMAVAYWNEVLDRDAQIGIDEYETDFIEKAMDFDIGLKEMLPEPSVKLPDWVIKKKNNISYGGYSVVDEYI